MAKEDEVKTPPSMNVTLSESELKEFALSEAPESIDQPKDDTKTDEVAEKTAAEAAEKEAAEKATAEAEAKEKEEEGGKDQDEKDKAEAEVKAKAEAEAEAKKKAEAEEEDEEDPVLVEYAGKSYTQSDFDVLIKGNMQEADYTQKTQELGTQRAAIEPLITLIGQLKDGDSKEIVADIRAALVEDKGEEAGKLFDQALNFKPEEFAHPDAQKAKDLQGEVDKYKAEHAFAEAQTTFISDMKGKGIKVSRKEATEVGQFTLDYFIKTQAALTLEDAYKLMKADGWRTKAADVDKAATEAEKKVAEEKAKKGHDKIPLKDKGASDFSTEKKTPTDLTVTMEEAKEAGVPTFFE